MRPVVWKICALSPCYRLFRLLLSRQITTLPKHIKMINDWQNLTNHFPHVSVLFLVCFVNSSMAYQYNYTWQGDQIKVLCFCSLINKKCLPSSSLERNVFFLKEIAYKCEFLVEKRPIQSLFNENKTDEQNWRVIVARDPSVTARIEKIQGIERYSGTPI